MAPAHHLGVNPQAMGGKWEVRALAVKHQIVIERIGGAPRAAHQSPGQAAANDRLRRVHIARLGKQAGELVVMGRVAAPGHRVRERAQQSGEPIGMRLSHVGAKPEHLFGRGAQHLRLGSNDDACSGLHRQARPGRADAEAVNLTLAQGVRHIGRRDNDQTHVAVGIQPASGEERAQFVIVGGERVCDRESGFHGHLACHPADRARGVERGRKGRQVKSRGERGRDGDRIAAQTQGERHDHGGVERHEPEIGRDRQWGQHVGDIEVLDHQPIPQRRPGRFAVQRQINPFRRREALFKGDDQRRAVD